MEPKIVAYISCGITLVFTLVTLFLLLFGWIHKNRISEYNSHAAIFFYISVGALGFLTFLKPIRKTFSIFTSKKDRAGSNMVGGTFASKASNLRNASLNVAASAAASTRNFSQKASNLRNASSNAFDKTTRYFGKRALDVIRPFRGKATKSGDFTPLQQMLQEGIPPFSNLVGVVTIRDLIVPNNILTIILTIAFGLFLLLVAIPHLFGNTNNSNNIEKGESKNLSYIATALLAGLIIYMIISLFGGASKWFTHLSEGHTFLTVIATFFKVFIILLIAVCSCGPAIGIIQPEVNLNMLKSRMPADTLDSLKKFAGRVGAAEATSV